MATAARKSSAPLDADKVATALEMLLADCREMIEQDPDLVLDLAESETDAFEVIDALLIADGFDAELIKGAKAAKDVIDSRMKRFEQRAERRRAVIERFLLILEQKKLERPGATITLAERKPTVEIEDESAIPSQFYRTPDPVLDKKALNAHVAELLAKQDAEIAAAKAEGREPQMFPLPDGVRLTNGSTSLTIRRR
jgi:hypothetical protein